MVAALSDQQVHDVEAQRLDVAGLLGQYTLRRVETKIG